MAKKFMGSILVLVILILFCWPAAIIYFFMKREEVRLCPRCGQELDLRSVACSRCGTPLGGPPGYGAPQQQYPPPPPQY